LTPARSSGAVPGGPLTTSRASSTPSRILREWINRTDPGIGAKGARLYPSET
jgi:hypothetical protein